MRAPGVQPIRALLCWWLLLFSSANQLPAQQQQFKQYGNTDGLANLNVHALLQDNVGFLWVGTDNGLFRYDGSHFREYGHTNGLPSTEVHVVVQSAQSGELWVATTGGLARFDRSDSMYVRSWPEPALSDIRQMAFDPAGNLYLLRPSQLLKCLTHGEDRPTCTVVASGELQSFLIHGTSLLFSRSGRLWRKDLGAAEVMQATPGLPADNWQALLEDRAGNLWVRSDTRLFERYARTSAFADRSSGVEHDPEPHLAVDRIGHVFVSTLSGAVSFEEQRRSVLSTGHGASDDAVGPLLVDREGNLWLGMSGGGLLRRLGQGEWSSWKRENGLLNNSVWAIRRAGDGALWAGTSAGLTIFDRHGRPTHSITPRTGLPSDRVLSIEPAFTGDVFVGTDPGGVTQLSTAGSILRVYGSEAGLRGRISASAVDHENRLWVVGSKGVFRSDRLERAGQHLRFTRLSIPSTTADAIFRDVLVTRAGAVWIASSEGLSMLFQGRWMSFKEHEGLVAKDLDVLAEKDGVLWVAYRDALGISRFERQGDHLQGITITKGAGLSSDVVYALSFDRQGNLWATSDRGADVLEEGRWRHFDSSNGLIWDDANSHSLDTDDDEGIWIGTSEGMSRFSPTKEAFYKQQPHTVVTDIHTGARQWSPTQEPSLPYTQREISLHFASLDFANPPAAFRYRLSGYSRGWVETQGHSVQFEALPAGEHLFEVQAQSGDGLWNSSPAQVRFHILFPWWQRWYSLVGFCLAGLLLIPAVWRLRMRALLAQKAHLQQIVDQQTNELRENYNRMADIAYQDQLTSLPNRRKFSEEIRHRCQLGVHSVLLLVDLDRFKAVNDTHGHDAGDVVLTATANRLQEAVPEEALVARLGGDEFAVLFDAAAFYAEQVETICRRVLEHCSAPIPFQDRTLHVACSIGMAVSDPQLRREDDLYKAADLALYEAKRGGRNGFRKYIPDALRPVPDAAPWSSGVGASSIAPRSAAALVQD